MSGKGQNDEAATFGDRSSTARATTEMAMVGRVESAPSTLTNGSHASSDSTMLHVANPNLRSLPMSTLPRVPTSDEGSNASRGRAAAADTSDHGRNRSRSITPRQSIQDGGSERSVRSSAVNVGRARPSGYADVVFSALDHRTPDQNLKDLIVEHAALKKLKEESATKYQNHLLPPFRDRNPWEASRGHQPNVGQDQVEPKDSS